jgi:DeoR/GlpR family transcriptional regulator of sugar metabolism
MSSDPSSTANRSELILQELLRHGEVSVDRLAKHFRVSAHTVRRELGQRLIMY